MPIRSDPYLQLRGQGQMLRASELARALKARRCGRGWIARCPAHDDRRPSLSITEARSGRPMLKCFAGCESRDVLAAVRALHSTAHGAGHEALPESRSKRDFLAVAERLWGEGRPLAGSAAARYLEGRGIRGLSPEGLRFHPRLRHPSGTFWPTLMARVTHGITDSPMGLHRTFLTASGSGKAPLLPDKMMLGPCAGGAVKLAAPGRLLMIGEGIETVLSAMVATGQPGWSALSTSGLASLGLSANVHEVIILADGDAAGALAARRAAQRWTAEGRQVRIAAAPPDTDFNDILRGKINGAYHVD